MAPATRWGLSVTDSFPALFTGVTWTCTASSGLDLRVAVGHGNDRHDG